MALTERAAKAIREDFKANPPTYKANRPTKAKPKGLVRNPVVKFHRNGAVGSTFYSVEFETPDPNAPLCVLKLTAVMPAIYVQVGGSAVACYVVPGVWPGDRFAPEILAAIQDAGIDTRLDSDDDRVVL